MIKKIALTLTLLTQLSFAATPEQVEQYLLVSNAEEELISLEAQFSAMQNGFRPDANESKNKTYDMQLITVRFKEYLEKHLSDDEMEKVLENYKNIVMLQYVSAQGATDYDANTVSTYIAKLEADTGASVRMDLIKKISKKFFSEEAMTIMFEELMLPLMKNGMGAKKMDDKMLKGAKESYLKNIDEDTTKTDMYLLRDFSLEELEELLKIAKTPAVGYETKAVSAAISYALKDFFMGMTSRYDVSKHKPKEIENTKHTK